MNTIIFILGGKNKANHCTQIEMGCTKNNWRIIIMGATAVDDIQT